MGNEEEYSQILKQKSQKFYSELNRIDTTETMNGNDHNSLSEKIQLKVFISQIENDCSYTIKLYNIIGGKKYPLNEITNCYIQKNKTAVLNHRTIIRYYFERDQPLSVEIIKNKGGFSKMYQINTKLGCVMGSRKNTLLQYLSNSKRETLVLKAEKLKQSEDIINIQFVVTPTNNYVSLKDPKNKMYYEIYSDNLSYRSEFLNDKGVFNPAKIPLGLFKNNKKIIKFFKIYKKAKGNFLVTINELISGKIFNVTINGIPFQIISKCKITKNYTFVDYLQAGVQIGLSVAIDLPCSHVNRP